MYFILFYHLSNSLYFSPYNLITIYDFKVISIGSQGNFETGLKVFSDIFKVKGYSVFSASVVIASTRIYTKLSGRSSTTVLFIVLVDIKSGVECSSRRTLSNVHSSSLLLKSALLSTRGKGFDEVLCFSVR